MGNESRTMSNTTVTTGGAETGYRSGKPEFTPVFSRVRVAHYLVFYVVFYRSVFVLFAIILYDFRQFTASDYSFAILKLFE
jgi:hypothetical protein